MKYIVANWKANKNIHQADIWIKTLLSQKKLLSQQNLTIIIATPYPYLPLLTDRLKKYKNIHPAAQSVSSLENGSHTAQVTASMLKDFVNYVLIGHSETNLVYKESLSDLEKKVANCKKQALTPIIFIPNLSTIPNNYPSESFLAYEPPSAISTSKNSTPPTPQKVNQFIKNLKTKNNKNKIIYLYGGSVNPDNVVDYIKVVDGVVPGSASLDVETFIKLVINVHKST